MSAARCMALVALADVVRLVLVLSEPWWPSSRERRAG